MKVRCPHDGLVDVGTLKPHPQNPNTHTKEQIDRLAKILEYQGWRKPIVVSNRSGFITSGHGRLAAAMVNRWSHVPVSFQDYDDEDMEIADLVADNAIAEWAELDLAKINTFIPDLSPEFDIDMFGIKDFVIEPADKYGEPDDVPEVPKVAKTKRGELWTLGNHRLLIDDCTVKENVERLMAGEKADMVFTDPPYGIGYEYASHDDSSSDDNAQLVAAALLAQDCGKVWTPGLMNLHRELARFDGAKVAVWYKKFAQAGSGLGGASTWEPVIVLNPTARKLPNDVLVVSTEREFLNGQSLRELHSCPKPVELYEQLLQGLSNHGERIFEPFAGSGSTLIACEKTGRKCYGMEIEPLYGDVIISRWCKFAGKEAYRENADGSKTPWSQINA